MTIFAHRVCCRSPIIPARPTFSAEMLNISPANNESSDSNIWTNPLAANTYSASLDNIAHRVSAYFDLTFDSPKKNKRQKLT